MFRRILDCILDRIAGALAPHVDRRLRDRQIQISVETIHDKDGFHLSLK
jgi:hypothetical protein